MKHDGKLDFKERWNRLAPIALGVVGHRDIDPGAHQRIRSELREKMRELIERLPSTPFLLLTPLAEGADRFVAKFLLQEGDGEEDPQLRKADRAMLAGRVRLVAVLPMEEDAYREDFKTEESEKEFDALLKSAERVVEMPWLDGYNRENAKDLPEGHPDLDENATRRALQYALGGLFVAQRSQVMFALYDGVPTNYVGGTDYILKATREGRLSMDDPSYGPLYWQGVAEPFRPPDGYVDPSEETLVYRIFTPRLKRKPEEYANADKSTTILLPARIERQLLRHASRDFRDRTFDTLSRLNTFNEDSMALFSETGAAANADGDFYPLIPTMGAERRKSASASAGDGLGQLHDGYESADRLAQANQRIAKRTLHWYTVGALAAILTFLLYSKLTKFGHGEEHGDAMKYGWLAMYVVILSVFGLRYALLRRGGAHPLKRRPPRQERYEEYRALAEGLRAQFFWHLAGIGSFASDHYLRPQRSALNWVRIALETMSLSSRRLERAGETPEHSGLLSAREHWIGGQAEYFQRKIHVHPKKGESWTSLMKRRWKSPKWQTVILHGVSTGLMGASFVLAAWQLCKGNFAEPRHHPPFHSPVVFGVAIGLAGLSVVALLWNKLRELRPEWKHSPDVARYELAVPAVVGLFSLILSALAIQALPLWLTDHNALSLQGGESGMAYWWSGFVALNIGFSGLAHFYLDKRGWAEESRHYEQSSVIFTSAARTFDELESLRARMECAEQVDEAKAALKRMRSVVFELGKEALEENGDWVMLRRNKPLEVPHAH